MAAMLSTIYREALDELPHKNRRQQAMERALDLAESRLPATFELDIISPEELPPRFPDTERLWIAMSAPPVGLTGMVMGTGSSFTLALRDLARRLT